MENWSAHENRTPIWNYIKQDWLFGEVKPRGRGYALTNTEREMRASATSLVLKIISRDIRFGEGGRCWVPRAYKRASTPLKRFCLMHHWGGGSEGR